MGINDSTGRLGQKVYTFETSGSNATSAVSVINSDTGQRASLMAIAETTHASKTIRVGTFAHDDLFADAVGRDPQIDGLAKVTFNFLKQLTHGQHELESSDPLRIMSFRAGNYFDEKKFNANDRGRFSYIDAIDSNENEGRIHQDMALHIDSVNSGSQSEIYEFMADVVGPNRDWGTQYNVIMVRPSIDQTHLTMALDWAAETGGSVMFVYDSSSNRADLVDPHPSTTQYLKSIGITPSDGLNTFLNTGNYAPTRIDPFQASYLKDALGIFEGDQGTEADKRLLSVDSLTLPAEIHDVNGLKVADVTWVTSDSSVMSATGALAASGDVTLTATITALDGSTSSVDHYITTANLLQANGDPVEAGLRFEFLNWIDNTDGRDFNRADQLYETDLSQSELDRQPQEIFNLAAEGPLDYAISSNLTLSLQGNADPFVTLRTNVPNSDPNLNDENHVMLITGYVVANATGDYELEFGVDRKNLMQVFVETDSGYKSALNDTTEISNSGRYLEQVTNLDMTAGTKYRIVAMVRKNSAVKSFSMQWKEPDTATFSDIPSNNLIARPSAYPVSGRKDGNFFDFIDFDNDPWSTVSANSDLNADTVWNQNEFDATYQNVNAVQSSEDLSLDLEYYQAPIENLILTNAVMEAARTVSLNVYDVSTGDLHHSLYNWALDTTSTITMASFASQLQGKLRTDLNDNNLSVTVNNGVVTLTDPDGALVI
jgi:hypothetical protein